MRAAADLAVVGAGAAGVSAAVEAARLGCRAVLLDADGSAGGIVRHAFEIRNMPGGTISGAAMGALLAGQLEGWDIAVERRRVEEVEETDSGVVLIDDTGGRVEAPAAVIATGAAPVVPLIEGLPERFVRGSILHPFADEVPEAGTPCTVAVLGGSDAAFDQARMLASRGVTAVVVCRSASPSAPPWLVSAALGEGVRLMAGKVVERAVARGPECTLELSGGAVLAVGAVVAAVGRRPALPGIAERGRGRLMVAGDAVGRRGRYLSAAMADGCLAARSLLERHCTAGGM